MFNKIKEYIKSKYRGHEEANKYPDGIKPYSYFVSRFHYHPNVFAFASSDESGEVNVKVDISKFDELISKHYNGYETTDYTVVNSMGKHLITNRTYVFPKYQIVLELNTYLIQSNIFYKESNILFEDIFSFLKDCTNVDDSEELVSPINNELSEDSEDESEESKPKINFVGFKHDDGNAVLYYIRMNKSKFDFGFYDESLVEFDELLQKVLNTDNLNAEILLYGPTGCGKSTYVQHLVESCPDVKFVFLRNDEVFNLTRPDYIKAFYGINNICLVIDDASGFTRDREEYKVSNGSYDLGTYVSGIYSSAFNNMKILIVNDGTTEMDRTFTDNATMSYKFDYIPVEKFLDKREITKEEFDESGLDENKLTISNMIYGLSKYKYHDDDKSTKIGF